MHVSKKSLRHKKGEDDLRSLGLDQGHVDVLCVLDLVVVERVVLRSSAVHPDCARTLDQGTSSIVDVDLAMVGQVKFMVGYPQPGVLEVSRGGLGDVQKHEGAEALGVRGSSSVGRLSTGVALQLRSSEATDSEVNIPHSNRALSLFSDVPFDEDTTGSRALGGNDELRQLNVSLVAWLADLKHGNGVLHVREGLAGGHQHRPDFSGDLDVLGHLDSGGDEVGTMVEVDDLVGSGFVKNSLDGLGVVCLAITLGSGTLDADELVGGDVLVLWFCALKDLTGLVEQDGWLAGLGKSSLNTGLGHRGGWTGGRATSWWSRGRGS